MSGDHLSLTERLSGNINFDRGFHIPGKVDISLQGKDGESYNTGLLGEGESNNSMRVNYLYKKYHYKGDKDYEGYDELYGKNLPYEDCVNLSIQDSQKK
jgi:hypothetical protein